MAVATTRNAQQEEAVKNQLTYLPSTDEAFNPNTVGVFIDLVNEFVTLYVERRASNGEPLSLQDFAGEVNWEIGRRDGVAEEQERQENS